MAALVTLVTGALVPVGDLAAQSEHIHISASPMSDDGDHKHLGGTGQAILTIAPGQFDAKILVEAFSPSWTLAPAATDIVVPREFGALQSIPPVDPPPPRAPIRFA